MRHDHDGVAILLRQLAQAFEQFHLRADVQMQRGLVEQDQPRLLRQRPRQNHALFFAAGKFAHRALRQMLRAHLREGVAGDFDVLRDSQIAAPARTG